MPGNRKIVWPFCVAGSGGTVHCVVIFDTGVPVLFDHDA